MDRVNHKSINLYEEAKAGFSSLIQQTVTVFVGFIVMLLISGGAPSGSVLTLSFCLGTTFVAWSEQRRLKQMTSTSPPHTTEVDPDVLRQVSISKEISTQDKSESITETNKASLDMALSASSTEEVQQLLEQLEAGVLAVTKSSHSIWNAQFRTLLEANTPETLSLFVFIKRNLRQFNLDTYYDLSDIISEVYIRGISKLNSGYEISNPLAWIRATSFNIIRERSRAETKQRDSLTQPKAFEAFEETSRTDLDLENSLEQLQQALKQLEVVDQKLITMRIIERLSWKEVSDRLAADGNQVLSEVVLRQRGARALRRLRQIYHESLNRG